jgi:anti-sigma-K factor RskA
MERLSWMTQAGAVAFPLRPVEPSGARFARGVLYVAADHQHWFLKVVGLPPPAAGRGYQVWFVTAAGPVSAGMLGPATAAGAELGSASMPAGVEAVAITLEPATGMPQPTGAQVLAGSQVNQLL